MKIILLDNIASLGRKGDIKHVSDGYAMNYLFPQGKATPATPNNMSQYLGTPTEEDKKEIEQNNFYKKVKSTLDRTTIYFSAKVSTQHVLYQGISILTVVDAIKERYGMELNANWFSGTRIMKETGRHKLMINLPNSEKVVLYINIKPL